MKPLRKIKTSLLSRGLAMTKLSLKTGSAVLGHGLGSVFNSSEDNEKRWQKLLADQAFALAEDLGQLKGSLMKSGQMLSMYGELFLPENANFFLKKLQAQSPSLEFSEIFKVIKNELGADLASLLDIDKSPIGTASLGQVHRVHYADQDLAMKIQYPGVAAAIDSDLKAIRSMLSILKLVPNNVQSDLLFSEVRNMLQQEVDYEKELQYTLQYFEKVGADPRFVIPRPFLELCSAKILTTGYEEGLAPDSPEVQSLPQDQRNELAKNFLDLYFKELFSLQLMQTDPHMGNYKVRLGTKNQWVLLDFGAVKNFSDGFIASYKKLLRATLNQDRDALLLAAIELGYLAPSDSLDLRAQFLDFCIMATEPFAGNDYDWKKSDLAKRLSVMAFQVAKKYPVRSPPPESIFLDRKTGGVFVMLSILGANFSGREIIEKYL
jgi:predicted unusual protein kinase regulating ubiquinone biosynthesis (AarF/ABC1/UbiB family)